MNAALQRLDDVLRKPENAEIEEELVALALVKIEEAVRETRVRYQAAEESAGGTR